MWKEILNLFRGGEKVQQQSSGESAMKFSTAVGGSASGEILLGYGLHEIKIVIDNKPCTVFLGIEDPTGGVAVCHGNVNKIGVRILDDGFILYADIQTNTALVKWTCEF